MISVCIPVYNRYVSELVKALKKESESSGIRVEILLLDDASEKAYRQSNSKLAEISGVKYNELGHNAGRSRVRNLLYEQSTQQYLLFLDCDTIPANDNFLEAYAENATPGTVVCGGHIYSKDPPSPDYLLHWLAGTRREVKPAGLRQQQPYRSFMSSSFLICRNVFENIRFSEKLAGYGHEDTLFGYELMKAGIELRHIDNPAVHTGLEKADTFLEKSVEALNNLLAAMDITISDPGFMQSVKILRTYKRIRKYKLCGIYRFISGIFSGPMRSNLKGPSPRLWVLDLYKLSVLCQKGRELT